MNGYFDHNATSPMTEAAREEWLRVETSHWHNPSSLYREAGMAKRMLGDLREEVADQLGCEHPERVVFTSGATEANNAVMRFVAKQRSGAILASAVEHPSVMDSATQVFSEKLEWPMVDGVINGGAIPGDRPALISVMAANNETGVVQPWREIALGFGGREVWYHCDAAQWIGKLDAGGLGQCDFVTGCAHKFGGPKGVGFLLLPESVAAGTDSVDFVSLKGGPQENRHRAGTENLAGIAAMMTAWRERNDLVANEAFVRARSAERDQFESEVRERIAGSEIVGGNSQRLWNTSMLIVPAHSNLKWLTRLSRRGFCISTGSACSAGKGNPSHVMEAMGLDHDQMGRVLRISGGWETSPDDWRAMAAALIEVWGELESGERPRAF